MNDTERIWIVRSHFFTQFEYERKKSRSNITFIDSPWRRCACCTPLSRREWRWSIQDDFVYSIILFVPGRNFYWVHINKYGFVELLTLRRWTDSSKEFRVEKILPVVWSYVFLFFYAFAIFDPLRDVNDCSMSSAQSSIDFHFFLLLRRIWAMVLVSSLASTGGAAFRLKSRGSPNTSGSTLAGTRRFLPGFLPSLHDSFFPTKSRRTRASSSWGRLSSGLLNCLFLHLLLLFIINKGIVGVIFLICRLFELYFHCVFVCLCLKLQKLEILTSLLIASWAVSKRSFFEILK